MATFIGGGEDPAFLDDVLIKEGSLKKWEKRLKSESPTNWYEGWDKADPQSTLTIDSGDWRVHYLYRYPLTFMHKKRFVFGVMKDPDFVHMDQITDDIVWAKIGDERVVVEREDFPRFTTRDEIRFSHTPKLTEYPNVFRLGNGYSISCNRRVSLRQYGARTTGEAWWMIGPTSQEAELSRRVFMIKIYDGPYKYQARGTDIRLSDPAPLSSKSEYVIYSYDDEGMRGLYREIYDGIKPQKHAMTIRGQELWDQIREKSGRITFKNDQIVGPGKVKYVFPLLSTKLLKIEWRGSEIDYRFRPDATEWVKINNYDGKAVSELELEFDVYSSLSSFRIEWESLRDWEPVGRPKVDILPAGWGGNLIKLEVEEGEGLVQTNDLYTGAYTVSANVRCHEGQAVIDVGGIEVVNWNPLDKSIRGAGDFVANNDEYDFTLTGIGHTVYEIDRFRIGEAGQKDWLPEDIKWYVETEKGRVDASDSINAPNMPVSVGEAKRWRIGVEVPQKIGDVDEIAISGIYNETFRTGDAHILKTIKWAGDGKSRVHYPQNVTRLPVLGDYIPVEGKGAVAWEQDVANDEGDVLILLDESRVAYKEEYTYRPVEIRNRRWRVQILEQRANVYFDNRFVGYMIGQGLPFRVTQDNTEDVQVDCASGLIQMRRDLGPRFEGWDIGIANIDTATYGPRVVFGKDRQEAQENIPFYVVRIAR
jgi:hypothetical protein